ncbi:hypothetical protein ALI144C_02180 [Actinosynnema sp. ALI-1.44]|uniref:hypothetical protein n=1 Tax=Actinosynnema sp. ALI-1.44 TaxID=1933779 RepID=UPI00097CB370|nr:hypothetical protein [Actinosynnema sp. ALI-1.44]ONI90785.1 hypothetical protein ALI144C_02180 [Actinosynnema sp. ALI-1.44]
MNDSGTSAEVDTITFVAGADTEVERDTIAGWTAAGLLHDSIWLDLSDDQFAHGDPLQTPVRYVTSVDTKTMPVREIYGQNKYQVVRVVALRPITAVHKGDEPMSDLWSFADDLKARLGSQTVLRRINLLVPDGTDVWTKQLLEPGCDINVIVSPEDRPREGAIDLGLSRPEIFRAHTALACASVAGLWRHADRGAFDQIEGQGAGNHGRIVVTRAMARVVDGRMMPEEVVDRLMRDGVTSLNRHRGPDPNRTAHDEAVVDAAVAMMLKMEDGEFSYRPPRLEIKEPTDHLAVKTLRMLVRFSLQLAKIRMLEWQQSGTMELATAAQEWLERTVVDVAPNEIGRRVVTAGEMLEVARDAPDQLRGLLPGTVPVSTQVWSPLRRLSFSLVDGGDLPPEVEASWNTLRPGVSDPKWVAPPPRRGLDLDKSEQDVLGSIDLPPTRRIRPGDVNMIAALYERLAELPGGDKLKAFRDRVNDWVTERREDKSLLGKLSTHVSDEMRKASGDLGRRAVEYAEAQRERKAVLNELDRIRTRLGNQVWAMLIGFIGLVGWLVSVAVTPLPQWALILSVSAAILGGGYAVLWMLALAARAAALERDLQYVDSRLRAHVAAIERWPAEVDRLTSVYEVLVDWGEVIGWMLHEPYGEAHASVPGPADMTRPEAFRVARPEVTTEQFDEVIDRTTKDVFGKGWLTRLYGVLKQTLIPNPEGRSGGQVDPDASPGPGPNDAQADPAKPPKHARDKLLREFRNGNCGTIAKDELTDRIRDALLDQAPEQVMPMVTADSTGSLMSTPEFLTAVLPEPTDDAPSQPLASTVFSDQGRIRGRGNVAKVYLWGPFEQWTRSSLRLPQHDHVVKRGNPAKDLPYQMSVIRLDVSEGCEEADLRLLAEQ